VTKSEVAMVHAGDLQDLAGEHERSRSVDFEDGMRRHRLQVAASRLAMYERLPRAGSTRYDRGNRHVID
jgi:hypothetical protein